MVFAVRRLIDRIREEDQEERRRVAVRQQAALARKWDRLSGFSPPSLNPLGTIYEQAREQDSTLRPQRFVRQQAEQERIAASLFNLQPPAIEPPAEPPPTGLEGLAQGFAPSVPPLLAAQGLAFQGAPEPLEAARLRAGGEGAQQFFEQVPEEDFPAIRDLAATLQSEGLAPQQFIDLPIDEQLEMAWPEIPRPSLGSRLQQAGGLTLAAAREEVEIGRPATEPAGRFLGEAAAGIPAALGLPLPREVLREPLGRVGEVAVPEVAVLSNLIPIPIADDLLRVFAKGAPIAARFLSREGRMATRAELRQLVEQVTRFARRKPALDQQADEVIEQVGGALPQRAAPAELAPEMPAGAVPEVPVEARAAEAAVPAQAVPAEAAPAPPARALEAEPVSGTGRVITADDALDDARRVRARTVRGVSGGAVEPAAIDAPVPDPRLNPAFQKVEVNDSLYSYRLRLGKANSEAAAFGDAFRVGERQLLDIDDLGNLRNVKAKETGRSLHWNDVFSEPEEYIWPSKEARAYADSWYAVELAKTEQLVEAGILSKRVLARQGPGRYIKRAVVSIDEEAVRIGPRGRIGTKQTFELPRTREFAGEQGKVPIRYALPADTLEVYLKEADRRLADAAFARRINRFGLTPAQRIESGLKVKTVEAQREVRAATVALNRAKRKLTREQGVVKGRKQRGGQAGARLERVQEEVAEAQSRLDRAQPVLREARGEKARALRVAGRPRGPSEAFLPEPFASSRIFPREVAQRVEGGLHLPTRGPARTAASLLSSVTDINDILRPVWAAGDLSFTALQTAPALGVNPRGWIEMQRIVLASLVEPDAYYKYVERNLPLVRRLIDDGVPWYGSEFTFEAALKGPVGKQVETALKIMKPLKIGNDSWNRALNVISTELYRQGDTMLSEVGEGAFSGSLRRAFGPVAKGTEAREQLAAVIAHGTGRMSLPEMAKQGPLQRQLMRALPFAGRYWTAWGKLIVDAGRGGMRGNLARRMLAGWAATGVGLYSLIAWATGQDVNLDPRKPGEFLTLEFAGIKGGLGGPIQQMLVLAGRLADNPDEAHETLTRFARGKASPFVSLVTDLMAMRSTYMGEPLDSWPDRLQYLVSKMVPFAGQESVRELARGDVEAAGEEAKAGTATFFGLRGYPVGEWQDFKRTFEERFGREYGRAGDRLLAEDDPQLTPMLEAAEAAQRERGYEPAVEAQEREQFLVAREQELRLPEKAASVLRGNIAAVAGFDEAYDEFRSTAADAAAQDFFGTEPREAQEEDRRYNEYREISPWDKQFQKPETLEIDWGLYMEAKDAARERLPPELQQAIENRTSVQDEGAIRLARALRDWRDELDPYYQREEGRQREAFRRTNPQIDAILWITGSTTGVLTQRAQTLAADMLREGLGVRIQTADVFRRAPRGGGRGRPSRR